ncbi:MAG: hypothetical protein OEX81_04145 [Candidatus Pacebacteria bacterium]|nr:hypothetical protein [Candidatus Paceibacterota bacterium]
MPQSKEHLKYYVINTIIGLMVIVFLAYPEISQAQDCDNTEDNSSIICEEPNGENDPGITVRSEELPPLLIPGLLPSTEVEQQSIYDQSALFAPDGNIVRFFYLADASVINQAPIINIEDLVLPIGDEYIPDSQRGYFDGHLAWDVTYRQIPEGQNSVSVIPPHPEAILLAAFDDIPLGEVAQRIQSSGSMEIYYLNIDNGEEVKPYLITFTHLTPESVRSAVTEAEENNGRVENAGKIGDTGLTDGLHIHMQVIDLNALYEIFDANEPITAYGLFADKENELTDEQLRRIFIDPSVIYPQLNDI